MSKKFILIGIIAVVALAFIIISCSDKQQSPVAVTGLDKEGTVSINCEEPPVEPPPTTECVPTTWDLIAGQHNDVGSVSVTNDETNISITYELDYPGACFGNLHAWVGTNLSDLPGGGTSRPSPGLLCKEPTGACYDATNLTSYTFTIALSLLGITDVCSEEPIYLYVVTHAEVFMDCNIKTEHETAFGGDQAGPGSSWWFYGKYEICCPTPPPPEKMCETAYAYGGEYAQCFIDLGLGFSNWGWTNYLGSDGIYEFPVYAGAGQCDVEKGMLVGYVTLTLDNGTITADLALVDDEYYFVEETHLFAARSLLPYNKKGKYTVAPGQYYVEPDLPDDGIFVIFHAVVCWYE